MCHVTGHNHPFSEIEMLTTPKRDSIKFPLHQLAIQQTQEKCFPSDGLVAPSSAPSEFPISPSVTEPWTVLLDLQEDTASLTRASCAFLIKQSPVIYDHRRGFFGITGLGN